jgi:large subunit ribosomal protein L25
VADTLHVTIRNETGKRRVRRLRRTGQIPANLYGHGEENVNLSVPAIPLAKYVNQGVQALELTGDVEETVLIRELQWDPFATEILHVDFLRVGAREKVETTVAIELRGEAPGVKEDGVVEQLLHEVVLQCPAMSIPEGLEVTINELGLDEQVRARDLALPRGASLVTDPDEVVVQCVQPAVPVEEEGEEAPLPESAEPELIGREEEEEEEGAQS